MIRTLRECAAPEDAVSELISFTLSLGGSAKAAMTQLIDSGVIPKPAEANRLSIEEASQMHETLTEKALEFFHIPFQPFAAPRGKDDVIDWPELKAVSKRIVRIVTSSTSMAVVTGPTGSGKTTMMRCLRGDLKAHGFRTINPSMLNMKQFTETTMHRLILEEVGNNSANFTDPQHRGREAQRALKSLDQRVVLMVDQAEDLSDDGFLLLKRANEWTDGGWDLLLRIIVFGQPQIKAQFESEKNKQFVVRSEIMDMPGLSKGWAYIAGRLKRTEMSPSDLENVFTPAGREAFDQKIRALSSARTVTPRDAENLASLAMNWAAKYGQQVTPEAVEHVQDRRRK